MAFFNDTKTVGTKSKNSASDSAVTILTSGCHFAGKLYCKGSSRIGGKIEGEIISEGLLIIEEGAIIHADVEAEEVILHGKFHGRLMASRKVELSKTSVFDGDVQTLSLLINEGAQFNGRISMKQEATEEKKEEASNFAGIDELLESPSRKRNGLLSSLSMQNTNS